MSYEPTNWKSGDTVTSAKLNKIEQGIANAGAMIVTDTDGTLDKTWQEIHDAVLTRPVIIQQSEEGYGAYYYNLYAIGEDSGTYEVVINTAGSPTVYTTDSADGYPVLQQ